MSVAGRKWKKQKTSRKFISLVNHQSNLLPLLPLLRSSWSSNCLSSIMVGVTFLITHQQLKKTFSKKMGNTIIEPSRQKCCLPSVFFASVTVLHSLNQIQTDSESSPTELSLVVSTVTDTQTKAIITCTFTLAGEGQWSRRMNKQYAENDRCRRSPAFFNLLLFPSSSYHILLAD